jgi:hypothetical protein
VKQVGLAAGGTAMRLIACAVILVLATQTFAAEIELSRDEQAILELTNAERQKEGVKPLKAERRLFLAARAHSENMARQQSLSHSLDGKQPWDRVAKTGYNFSQLAENVAFNQSTPKAAIKQWMDSPGHRENLLSKKYTETGIGIAKADNGDLYYTQVFAKPSANNTDTGDIPDQTSAPEKTIDSAKDVAELKAEIEELKKSLPEAKNAATESRTLKFEIRNASGKSIKVALPEGIKVLLDEDARKTLTVSTDDPEPVFEIKIGKRSKKAALKSGAVYKIEANDGVPEIWMKAENGAESGAEKTTTESGKLKISIGSD